MKKIMSFLLVTLLLGAMGVSVTANEHPVPDLTKKGSIEITMHSGETSVGGGTLTLYRVGEVSEDDGNYSFVPTGDFVDCGETYDDLESSDLAKSLSAYAQENDCASTTEKIDEKGVVTFDDLELGLYLLVQNEAADGYNAANPFVVSVPQLDDGEYIYDVEASPKVELTKAPEEPDEPDEPDEPKKPDEPKLPQTGQLNWPVPVLTVAGLGVFVLGFMLFSCKKKERNEK